MPKSLSDYKCERNNCCLLNKRNSTYSVFGKAKGIKTNYRLTNKNKNSISQYTIDDCVLKDLADENKCDYLFVIDKEEEKDAYFVEMKGQNIIHGCRQILNSIDELENNFNGEIFARIVTTSITTPKYNQDKNYKKLKGKLKNNFEHHNKIFEDVV